MFFGGLFVVFSALRRDRTPPKTKPCGMRTRSARRADADRACPLPEWAVNAVLLSDDLLPNVLTSLSISSTQPLVCNTWRNCWPLAVPQQIMREKRVPVVCECLAAFLTWSRIVGQCLSHLTTIADSDKADQEVVDAGALPTIVAAMKAHADDAYVQAGGCAVIGNTCFEGGTSAAARVRAQAAMHAGALPTVLAALQAHISNEDVQKTGCMAIACLCSGRDAAGEARMRAALDAGAQQAILAALSAHPGAAGVQDSGFTALANICFRNGDDGDATRQAAANAGALLLVLSGMRLHVEDAEVQANGCLSLANICWGVTEASLQTAADAGALSTIVAAMQAHPGDESVQRFGNDALHLICNESDARRAAALQAGAETEWLE